MKKRFFLVSILTAAAASALFVQQADAQEQRGSRGARWTFAPNIYKIEQPRIPQGYEAPSKVRQGAVPQSASFLGVDPGMLNSRPAPIAPRQQVAARPASPQVTGKAFVPNTSFHPSFGQPVQPLQAGAPMHMATLPPAVAPVPQAAAPAAARPAASPVHKATKPASRPYHATRTVSGVLKKPSKTAGQSASPAVATYSSGYMPGGHLPAQSGAGSSVKTAVNGRIIRH